MQRSWLPAASSAHFVALTSLPDFHPEQVKRLLLLTCILCLQLGEELAFVRDGHVEHVLSVGTCHTLLPAVDAIQGVAVLAGAPASIKLLGANLLLDDNVVLARARGELSAATSAIPTLLADCTAGFSRSLKIRFI